MGVVVIIFNSFVANYFKQNWVNCWPPFPFESLIIVAFSGAAMLSRATSKEIAAFLAEKKIHIYTPGDSGVALRSCYLGCLPRLRVLNTCQGVIS